jgi:predicted transcriptional regulator
MVSDLNESIFQAESYVSFLNSALGSSGKGAKSRRPRGSISKLAKFINCHTSFLAQVLSGRAQMSVDQIILCARYFNLNANAQDQLIDLLLFERSGLATAKKVFQNRLQARRSQRENISERWGEKAELPDLVRWQFFSSWLNQAVLSMLHIPKQDSARVLAESLSLPETLIQSVLQDLLSLGLVKRKSQSQYQACEAYLHLSKDAPMLGAHHQSWRLKAIGEFATSVESKGLHYSGAIAISQKNAETVQRELLKALDRIRDLVHSSQAEEAHAVLIDFFPLAKKEQP